MASSTGGSVKETAGKLFVPAVVAAGGALGYLLTKKDNVRGATPKLREAVSDLPRPQLPESVGDLAGDLKEQVESALGKGTSGASVASSGSVDHTELEQRRRDREERRRRRRQRSRR